MPNQTQSCKKKEKIDGLAAHAISDIKQALAAVKALKANSQLELNLEHAIKDCEAIKADPHTAQ